MKVPGPVESNTTQAGSLEEAQKTNPVINFDPGSCSWNTQSSSKGSSGEAKFVWLKSACGDKDSGLPALTLCPTSKNRKHSPFLSSILVGQRIASCPLIFCITTISSARRLCPQSYFKLTCGEAVLPSGWVPSKLCWLTPVVVLRLDPSCSIL